MVIVSGKLNQVTSNDEKISLIEVEIQEDLRLKMK